eukprot:650637-Alexandrium_andersonii.AAC.1
MPGLGPRSSSTTLKPVVCEVCGSMLNRWWPKRAMVMRRRPDETHGCRMGGMVRTLNEIRMCR